MAKHYRAMTPAEKCAHASAMVSSVMDIAGDLVGTGFYVGFSMTTSGALSVTALYDNNKARVYVEPDFTEDELAREMLSLYSLRDGQAVDRRPR